MWLDAGGFSTRPSSLDPGDHHTRNRIKPQWVPLHQQALFIRLFSLTPIKPALG
jgi:hypothetical protein